MSEFHSRPVYDWNNENWTPKCPYCEILDDWHEGKPIENVDHSSLTGVLMRDGSDGWLFVDAETSYPIDHCPKCGRRLDKNAKYVIVPLAYDEEGK